MVIIDRSAKESSGAYVVFSRIKRMVRAASLTQDRLDDNVFAICFELHIVQARQEDSAGCACVSRPSLNSLMKQEVDQ